MLEVCLLSQRSDVATPIRSVTERLSLSPASSTRCPISVPCGNACPEGRDNGLTLFRLNDTNDLVPAYTPAACICPCAPSPRWRQPAARLLAEACQRLWLLGNDGACGSSHLLDISFSLTLSPLGASSARERLTVFSLSEERSMLSRQLSTQPLPATPMPIGYCG